jgi:peptidoglycan/xylan/chitin deacetylase (PgdA/CDA1 family)
MRHWLSKYARLAQQYTQAKALVLMYHRVAEPDADIWDLAVSPVHFEQHLRILHQLGNVISTAELTERLQSRTLKKRSIAITFDDGYADNYLTACPLLIRYQLPATFFVVSGNVGLTQKFWWDELADILLLSDQLPKFFSLIMPDGTRLDANLESEQQLTPALRQQHQRWRVSHAAPPTERAALFYRIWHCLRPLVASAQQVLLQELRAWASQPVHARPAYHSISLKQLRELSENPLFTIGAHTVTHPALASHSTTVQEHELAASRQTLCKAIGQPIELLAYPYGSHSCETASIAAQVGFKAAFTTESRLVTNTDEIYTLGRFQVNNWNGDEFKRRLAQQFRNF